MGRLLGAFFAGGTVAVSAALLGLGRAGRALLDLIRRSTR
jgi:hypothetical protein